MLSVLALDVGSRLVPYAEAWQLQRSLHDDVARGVRDDTLILVEHPDTYTAGTATKPHDRPTGQTPVIDVDRGGKVTWHGPGQLVGYPILRLPDGVGAVDHVRRIERMLLAAFADLGVSGHLVPGRSGVWVPGTTSDDKVAAIGVRVSRAVTMHGFAVNCNPDLAAFSQITPCGITDAGVTSLTACSGSEISPRDALDAVETHARAVFDQPATEVPAPTRIEALV